MISRSAKLREVIETIRQGQEVEMKSLLKPNVEEARKTHALVDSVMRIAEKEKAWRLDPLIVNLSGFHRKNAYMLKHWDAIQAGSPRRDPLLSRAERLFFQALFMNPNDPSALDGIASVLMLEGETDASIFFDKRAIELAKAKGIDYKPARKNVALIESHQPKKRVTAPTSVTPRAAGDPAQARRHFSRGGILFAGRDYEAALKAFDEGLALAPYAAEGHVQRGASLVYLNRIDEGLRAIERALQLEPNRIDAHSARGAVLIGVGRYQEGMEEIDRVLAACPGDPQATYNKACAYGRLGEPVRAIELLESAVQSDGRYRDVARNDPHFDSLRGSSSVGKRFRALVGA
jgi:tetratricopeptide (TPR) repeat protein